MRLGATKVSTGDLEVAIEGFLGKLIGPAKASRSTAAAVSASRKRRSDCWEMLPITIVSSVVWCQM